MVKGKGRTAKEVPIVVNYLTFQSVDKPFLLAITEERGILKSEDNGMTWKEFGSVEKRRPALSNCPPIYGNNSFSKKLNHKVGGQYGC